MGRQPHGQRHREEEGIEGRPLQIDIDREDRQYQQQRHFHEQIAEAPYSPLEVGFCRPPHDVTGQLAELRIRSDLHHCDGRAAADDVSAHEHGIGALLERGRGRQDGGRLFGRVGLAGQGRFVYEKILRVEEQAVAGNA